MEHRPKYKILNSKVSRRKYRRIFPGPELGKDFLETSKQHSLATKENKND